jgi:hypothetical protein
LRHDRALRLGRVTASIVVFSSDVTFIDDDDATRREELEPSRWDLRLTSRRASNGSNRRDRVRDARPDTVSELGSGVSAREDPRRRAAGVVRRSVLPPRVVRSLRK